MKGGNSPYTYLVKRYHFKVVFTSLGTIIYFMGCRCRLRSVQMRKGCVCFFAKFERRDQMFYKRDLYS